MKKIILILISSLIFACAQPGYTPDYTEPAFTLELNNNFPEVSLQENNSQVSIVNISSDIIIKLVYTVNGKTITMIEAIVPGQIMLITVWLDNRSVICSIDEVVLY